MATKTGEPDAGHGPVPVCGVVHQARGEVPGFESESAVSEGAAMSSIKR